MDFSYSLNGRIAYLKVEDKSLHKRKLFIVTFKKQGASVKYSILQALQVLA